MHLQHKGLIAHYHFAATAGVYVAEITNVNDVVVFSARTLAELHQRMIEASENYIALLRHQSLFAVR